MTESGTGGSAPHSLPKIVGSFLTNKPTLTLGSAAVEVAAQMKVGFGPGIAVANTLGYGDESQIAIWRITSKPVELFSKSYTDPRAES